MNFTEVTKGFYLDYIEQLVLVVGFYGDYAVGVHIDHGKEPTGAFLYDRKTGKSPNCHTLVTKLNDSFIFEEEAIAALNKALMKSGENTLIRGRLMEMTALELLALTSTNGVYFRQGRNQK